MTFRNLSTLCLLWATAWGLVGCGGSGSSSGANNNSTQGAGGPPPVVSAGVYTGSVNQRNFVGVLTADSFLYSLIEAPIDDLYFGRVTDMGTTRATADPLNFFRNTTATGVQVKAILTPPTNGTLKLQMSQPDFNTDLVFESLKPVLEAASLNNVAHTWSGKLSYGYGSNLSFAATINSAGDISAPAGFGSSTACEFIGGSKLSPTSATTNVFNLTLVIANRTSCRLFTDQTLTGVAFVLANPAAGVTQRLVWIATAANGTGITFKADR